MSPSLDGGPPGRLRAAHTRDPHGGLVLLPGRNGHLTNLSTWSHAEELPFLSRALCSNGRIRLSFKESPVCG